MYLFLNLKWLTERKHNLRIDLSLVWNLSITPMPFCEISHGAWPCGLKTLNNSSHKVGSTCNMFSFHHFSWWKKGNTQKQHENIYAKCFCIYLYVRDIGTASKLEIFLLFTSFTASPRGLEWNSQVATSVSSVLTDVFDMLTALCEQQLQGITWHCKRKIAVNKYFESDVFIIRLPFLISFT